VRTTRKREADAAGSEARKARCLAPKQPNLAKSIFGHRSKKMMFVSKFSGTAVRKLVKKKNNVGVRFDLVLEKENTLINMHMIIPATVRHFVP
jgi:hypothetical protein